MEPRTGPDGGELLDVLREAQNLIESAITHHRSDRGLESGGLPGDAAAVRALATKLASQATAEVVWALPARELGPYEADRVLDAVASASRAGARTRVLSSPLSLEDKQATRLLATLDALAEVRLAPLPLADLLVCDGRVALVRATPGAGAVLMRDRAAVAAVELLARSAWAAATPRADLARLRVPLDLARRILSLLDGGQTDEVAARMLGISVRTYRRYVAQITRDLGAASRFQAGVRAGRLGLLEP
ncbi:helix-turn-helix transcriptional regulator [Actinokineospora inagensis]|uniref:helix-turn-helix transcriptional regulator n=1 Tax=Actinokineospora inagensis TaxID=103730 RepID=UPI0004059870|nr:hypothetical protein [Actinokineospora inagensis]